ncbi:hypothetical protein [Sphingobacterium sp. UBA7038]|nr:hypothetical protein [Sphingobacterium sp. UBA7038]
MTIINNNEMASVLLLHPLHLSRRGRSSDLQYACEGFGGIAGAI